jgi:hypothetical protein
MPTPRAYAAVAVLSGHIYVMGGRGPGGVVLGTVERYDPTSNTWTTVASLREPRMNAAATALGNRILLTGGREAYGGVTDDVEVYVPAENDWESFDSLERGREGHGAFTVNNLAYVFGGTGSSGGFLNDCEYYEVGDEHWYPYEDWTLGTARAAFATAVMNGGVLVFGGYSAFGPLSDVEFYVPGAGGSVRAPMPEPRGGLAGAGDDRRAWAIGGRNAANVVTGRVDAYEMVGDRWSPAPALPAPREGAVAAVVGEMLYVFGGDGGQGVLLTSSLALPTTTTAAEPEAPAGEPLALDVTGPNPFREGTRLALTLGASAPASVAVYDALGRRVALLEEGVLPAGRHTLAWDGTDGAGRPLPSGLYVVQAVAGERHAALRLTLAR